MKLRMKIGKCSNREKMESCMTAQKSNVNSFVQHSAHLITPFCRVRREAETTAIIELIAQCAKQGKRVLLCGSTQASIDNVLTRIMAKSHLVRLISPCVSVGRAAFTTRMFIPWSSRSSKNNTNEWGSAKKKPRTSFFVKATSRAGPCKAS